MKSLTRLFFSTEPAAESGLYQLLPLVSEFSTDLAILGISGLFLYRPDLFVHVLEGPNQRVMETFVRWSTRNPNARLRVHAAELISERRHEAWQVAYLSRSLTPAAVIRDAAVPPTDAQMAAWLAGIETRARVSPRTDPRPHAITPDVGGPSARRGA